LTVGRGNARPGLTTWRSSTYRPMKRNTEREEGKEVLKSCGRSTSDVGDVQAVDVETSSFVAVDKEKELPWHKPCASQKRDSTSYAGVFPLNSLSPVPPEDSPQLRPYTHRRSSTRATTWLRNLHFPSLSSPSSLWLACLRSITRSRLV